MSEQKPDPPSWFMGLALGVLAIVTLAAAGVVVYVLVLSANAFLK